MLVLPRPWVERAAGVRDGQDAGVRCGGQGGPAVSPGEHLQVTARALDQIHFGGRTTVKRTERGEQTKTAAEDPLHGHAAAVCAADAGSLLALAEGNRRDTASQTHRASAGGHTFSSSPQRPVLSTVERRPGGEGRSGAGDQTRRTRTCTRSPAEEPARQRPRQSNGISEDQPFLFAATRVT